MANALENLDSQTDLLNSPLGDIHELPIEALNFPRSYKRYKTVTIKRAANFLNEFGVRLPVLVDGDNNIVDGELWVMAARQLGRKNIPVLLTAGLSVEQRNAYRIGIQRIPESAKWDEEALAETFKNWLDQDLDFDIELTGFSMPEIDLMIEGAQETSTADTADKIEASDIGKPITKPGDVWCLGGHRLLCANSLDHASFEMLMKAERASAVISDPPYNTVIDGHVGGKGRIRHREFAMASGELTNEQFADFLKTALNLMANFSHDGSLHYVFMDWRHAAEVLQAGTAAFAELKNIVVWAKSNSGMGSFYRSRHELVFVFKKGGAPHRNNIELGKHGRNRDNVWHYPGANSFDGRQTDEGHLLALHPTVKPVQLVADAMLDCSARGEIILDPFVGSGSTVIAAERIGRRLYGIELDPRYVDICVRRWERHSGLRAIHAITGAIFDERNLPKHSRAKRASPDQTTSLADDVHPSNGRKTRRRRRCTTVTILQNSV